MIKQEFNIDNYWDVVVYWNVDYHFFDIIELELRMIGFSKAAVEGIRKSMVSGEAKAVTCSNNYKSVILFNKHSSIPDYISSIVHEAEHIKQSILKYYKVDDSGEAPAYTIGYIVKKMWEVFSRMITK